MPTTSKTHEGDDLSSSALYLDGSQVEADGSEVNLTSTMESNRAANRTDDGKDLLSSDLRTEACFRTCFIQISLTGTYYISILNEVREQSLLITESSICRRLKKKTIF